MVDTSMEQRIKSRLLELGSLPQDVAAKLKTLGIKGKIGEPCNCPIARYLNNDDSSPGTFTVDSSYVFNTVVIKVLGEEITYKNLNAIYTFIDQFDAGYYPELEE